MRGSDEIAKEIMAVITRMEKRQPGQRYIMSNQTSYMIRAIASQISGLDGRIEALERDVAELKKT
jgi:hypothetical protein